MAERSKRRSITGVVTSDRMAKTITVKSERRVIHPRFRKYVKKFTTCYAHDEKDEAQVGDTVRLMQTRPISKLKKWRLVEVISRTES